MAAALCRVGAVAVVRDFAESVSAAGTAGDFSPEGFEAIVFENGAESGLLDENVARGSETGRALRSLFKPADFFGRNRVAAAVATQDFERTL